MTKPKRLRDNDQPLAEPVPTPAAEFDINRPDTEEEAEEVRQVEGKRGARRAATNVKVSFDKNRRPPHGEWIISGELEGNKAMVRVLGGPNVEERIEAKKEEMILGLIKRCERKDYAVRFSQKIKLRSDLRKVIR